MSCTRSGALIARTKTAVRETVDAKKVRYGAGDLAALMKGARRIVVCKGAKVTEFTPATLEPEKLLGPSGNLRAPTARVGKDWYVGFGDETWKALLG